MRSAWRADPPDWVVQGEMPGIHFKPIGYSQVAVIGANQIYRRDNHIYD